jgi:UDP-N-acetylglucosamine 2-epimerase (non-hydrolysing)
LKVHLDVIVAARPNFMKVAPLYHELMRHTDWCAVRLIHTGQHYDANMSHAFLRDLKLPEPDLHLEIGSGSHAEQTAGVMVAYEKACLERRPDFLIVVGDVNSTLACALAASKLGIKVAHLEAGLRSGDRTMPEEINRLVTDTISDLLWTPSPDANENLAREGIPAHKVVYVGNIMIDSFEMMRASIEAAGTWRAMGVRRKEYGVVTLHRPSNVDDVAQLSSLAEVLIRSAARLPLVFPVHPRTRKQLESADLWNRLKSAKGVHLTEPAGYVEFMSLVSSAAYVLTDSGGVQEETTYLGIPCLTLRDTTERPITVSRGTNRLVTALTVEHSITEVLACRWPKGTIPDLWDGKTAPRVVDSIRKTVLDAESINL